MNWERQRHHQQSDNTILTLTYSTFPAIRKSPLNNKSNWKSTERSTIASNIPGSPQEKEHKSRNAGLERGGGENLIYLRSDIRVYEDLFRISQTLNTR